MIRCGSGGSKHDEIGSHSAARDDSILAGSCPIGQSDPPADGPWLILNGREILSPWEIRLVDGRVHINGLPLTAPAEDWIPSRRTVETGRAIQRLFDRARGWIREYPMETVLQRCVAYLDANEPLVENARVSDDWRDAITVRWTVDSTEEDLIIDFDHESAGPGPDDASTDLLDLIEEALAFEGNLVIVTNGGVRIETRPAGPALLAWIVEVVRDTPDVESREERLGARLMPDEASTIANCFGR